MQTQLQNIKINIDNGNPMGALSNSSPSVISKTN